MRLAMRVVLWVVALCALYPAAVLGFYFLAPQQNAKLGKVDTLIVLGCPTAADGSPTPEQRERVLEGVREFKRGESAHVIFTGAAAHNQFVEAHAMAMLAEANGVPAEAVVEEPQAQNTVQNIYYSERLMEERGWKTAEVISSPSHLPRTALILRRWKGLEWKEDAAQWPVEYGWGKKLNLYWREALGCWRIRWWGFGKSRFLPA